LYIYELAALSAAFSWALASLISASPSQKLGAIRFNRIRMTIVCILLVLYSSYTSSWSTLTEETVRLSLLSGFIGIFVGDTALFLTLNRMGPRRLSILFSLNAPLSAILAWWFLGEALTKISIAGILVSFMGVVLAITFSKPSSQVHHWEQIKGKTWVGIGFGLMAALSQSVGSIVARPVMETGADPMAVSAIRTAVGAIGLTVLLQLGSKRFFASTEKLTLKLFSFTVLSGVIGMGIGMTLVLVGCGLIFMR